MKKGKNILFGYLGADAYQKISKYSNHELINQQILNDTESKKNIPGSVGIVKGVKLKCDIDYPIIKTGNIFGKIEGKKKDSYLIISANIDHVGSGMSGKYFHGALNNASGVGMMLELAKVIKAQKNLPDKTIVFVGWNARENAAGSNYYISNPIYPIEKTQVINIDCIGNVYNEEIDFETEGEARIILRNRIFQYTEDLNNTRNLGIEAMESDVGRWSDNVPFVLAKVPTINITDGYYNLNTYKDTIDNVDKEKIGKIGITIVNYIKRDVYKDTFPDYLNKNEIALIILFLLGIIFIYMIFSLNKTNPSIKVFNLTVEDIYYSSVFNILLKCFYYVTPTLIILFSLIFIANLPPNFNLVFQNGESYANLSMYLTLKKSILYIRNLIFNGLGTTNNHIEIFQAILICMGKSLKLILMTITISLIFGILKGIFDSYKDGSKGDLRTVGTLMAFSLPDVFIVLCSMLLITYITNNDLLKQLIDLRSFKGFIIPLLTLSIIPTVYISRITFIVIQEEIKKGYIMAAKSKGLSKLKIFTKHILYGVIVKVVDSIPTLITIIISNLIIVEYLLNYKGIVFNLYRFYEGNDVESFIGFSLALGLIYTIFIIVSKLISKLINPMKREGVH